MIRIFVACCLLLVSGLCWTGMGAFTEEAKHTGVNNLRNQWTALVLALFFDLVGGCLLCQQPASGEELRYHRFGDTVYGSDGSRQHHFGGNLYYSDPSTGRRTVCHRFNNETKCEVQ